MAELLKIPIKAKCKCWKCYQLTKSQADHARYKNALNVSTATVRKSKRELERKIVNNIKLDPKAVYKYSRSKIKTKETIGPITDDNGERISNDSPIAKMLNDYFSNVFTDEILEDMPNPRVLMQDENLLINEVNLCAEAISKVLEKLNPEKSPGADQIYLVVLKTCH